MLEGIGDNIYCRPFVKQLVANGGKDVYIRTVLPEFFTDIKGVNLIHPEVVHYRTQKKNFAKMKAIPWVENPPVQFDEVCSINYLKADSEKYGIITTFETKMNLPVGSTDLRKHLDLPTNLEPHGLKLPEGRKIAIVRPSTVRKEWWITSRSADPTHLNWCIRTLKDAGYFTISVADADGENEWIVGEDPDVDLLLHRGELSISQVMDLVSKADVVVTGVNMMVPIALAAKVPTFVVFGGRGFYDTPYKVFDPRFDLSKVRWVLPDNFCRCGMAKHKCDKRISNLDDHFLKFCAEVLS